MTPPKSDLAALREALDETARTCHAFAQHVDRVQLDHPGDFDDCTSTRCVRARAALAANPEPDIPAIVDVSKEAERFAATPTAPALDEEHCCNDPSHMSPEYLAALAANPEPATMDADTEAAERQARYDGYPEDAATPTAPALDVERLARSMQTFYRNVEGVGDMRYAAERIAAEYVALSPAPTTEDEPQ